MKKSIVAIVVLSAVSASAFAANQTVNGVTQITTSQGAIAGFHVSGISGANYDLQKHEADISALNAGKASVSQANQIAGVATANSAVIQNQGQKIQNLQGQVAATQSQLSTTWQQTGKNQMLIQANQQAITQLNGQTQLTNAATTAAIKTNAAGIQTNSSAIKSIQQQVAGGVLKGDKGDQGKQGLKGDKGDRGLNGVTTTITKQINDVKTQARVAKNEQRISKVEKRIGEVEHTVKRIGATGAASANLHYNRTENGYAVALGEYAGATAIAGGVQFNTSKDTAITVQASYDGADVGASVGFHGSW